MDILDCYDHQQLGLEGTDDQQLFTATYEEAMLVILELKDRFGGSRLFGNEKDDSFKSSIGNIYLSFSGVNFYPTIEKKASKFSSIRQNNKYALNNLNLVFRQNQHGTLLSFTSIFVDFNR